MCIHRMFFEAGKTGDQDYVTALKAQGEKFKSGRSLAAATLLQRKVDAGTRITESVDDEVWSTVNAADRNGTLAELVAA